MTNKERFEDIKKTLHIHNELAKSQNEWLINRVRKLTEALEKIRDHKMDSIDKVYLLIQIEGYQKVAKEALEEQSDEA